MCTRIVRTMRNQWIVTARPYDQQSDASFFFFNISTYHSGSLRYKKKRKKKRVFYEHRLELVSPKWNSQVGETKTFFWRGLQTFSLFIFVYRALAVVQATGWRGKSDFATQRAERLQFVALTTVFSIFFSPFFYLLCFELYFSFSFFPFSFLISIYFSPLFFFVLLIYHLSSRQIENR